LGADVATSCAWLVVTSLLTCVVMFVLLTIYIVRSAPAVAWMTLLATLVAACVIEVVYHAYTGRRFQRLEDQPATPTPPTSPH
jgi:hypothetical protein